MSGRAAFKSPAARGVWLALGSLLVTACGNSGSPASDRDAFEVDADTGSGGALECADGARECDGACVNTATDPAHCGGCDQPCLQNALCIDATCACPAETEVCDAACVDTNSDPAHCGACGTACEASAPLCSQGQCVTGCADDELRCGDACVDPLVSTTHCGGCDAPCVAELYEVALCIGGFCEATCESGHVDVDGDPGCEYACSRTNAGLEICDGVDNNCDGTIDALDPLLRSDPCPQQLGVCAGSLADCVAGTASCDDATYAEAAEPAIWQPLGETRCDGVDNNCDGAVDPGCCASPTDSALVPAFVIPTGYSRWVERRPTAFVDGDRVRVLYERLVQPIDGELRRDVALATPPEAGGPLDSAIVLVGGDVVDWGGAVLGDRIVLFTVNGSNQIERHEFATNGTRLAGPDVVTERGAAVDDVFLLRAFHVVGAGTFVGIQTFTASRVQSRLLEVDDSGAVVASSDTESVESLGLALTRRGSGFVYVRRLGAPDDNYRLDYVPLTSQLAPDFPTPIFDTPNYSPFDPEWGVRRESPPALLIPRLEGGDAQLELVTFTSSGVERALLDEGFSPLGSATGFDADDHTLVAWTDTVDDTQQVSIAAVVPVEPDPDVEPPPVPVLVTELRGTLRGPLIYPVDLVSTDERGWIVLGAYAGETLNTRLVVYPLSAEGRPRCE